MLADAHLEELHNSSGHQGPSSSSSTTRALRSISPSRVPSAASEQQRQRTAATETPKSDKKDPSAPDGPQGPNRETNAVNRNFEDLDTGRYLTYVGALCCARMVFQHPLTIALARKQTCDAADRLSTRQIIHGIFRTEGGSLALTAGMGAFVVGTAASEVICMGLYEWARFSLPIANDVSRDALAGYIGDFACRWVYTPLLVIANRQMTARSATFQDKASKPYNPADWTFGQVVRSMWKEGGIRPFFAGFVTTLTFGCLWTAVWLAMYAQTKVVCYTAMERLLPSKFLANEKVPMWARSTEDNFVVNSVASAFTSGATAVMFNPFLVVRTRLQVTAGATLQSVVTSTFRQEGARGFFRGVSLNVGACVFDGWLLATTYEWAKLWSDKSRN